MNARDVVSALRELGQQDQNVIFAFIADHLYEMRLNSAGRINDLMDFKLFLHELAEAWRMAELPEGTIFPVSTKVLAMAGRSTRPAVIPQQTRWEGICPECGHFHADTEECGFPIGGGRYCRCCRKVVA